MEYRKYFIEVPLASWQIGNGLEDLGPSSDLGTVLAELKGRILEEF